MKKKITICKGAWFQNTGNRSYRVWLFTLDGDHYVFDGFVPANNMTQVIMPLGLVIGEVYATTMAPNKVTSRVDNREIFV